MKLNQGTESLISLLKMETSDNAINNDNTENDVLNQASTAHDTETAYRSHIHSVLGLVVLCCGIKDETGNNVIDIDHDPWKSMPREATKPKADQYRAEVLRRHSVF